MMRRSPEVPSSSRWRFEGAQEEIKKFLTAEQIGDFFKENITSLLGGVIETLKSSFIVLILLVFMLSEARMFSPQV